MERPLAANFWLDAEDDQLKGLSISRNNSINFGIINSITRLDLVGYFYWFILRCTDPWILNLRVYVSCRRCDFYIVWGCLRVLIVFPTFHLLTQLWQDLIYLTWIFCCYIESGLPPIFGCQSCWLCPRTLDSAMTRNQYETPLLTTFQVIQYICSFFLQSARAETLSQWTPTVYRTHTWSWSWFPIRTTSRRKQRRSDLAWIPSGTIH